MSDPFKKMPSFEQVVDKVLEIHTEVRELAQHAGHRIAQHEQDVKDNTALTDQALEEISLQLAFLMQMIQVQHRPQGAIAGLDGKVPVVVKTASQIYQETGRAKLIAQRKAFLDAQGVSTAEEAADAVVERVREALDGPGEAPTDATPEVTH